MPVEWLCAAYRFHFWRYIEIMLISAVAFIIVFSAVVLVHELGHFWMARRGDIVVQEFGLGYPPRLKTVAVRNGVEYTLNAIPVGGFVRLLGEEDPSHPGSFASKSAGVRLRTLLAGPVMNLLLAAALFMCAFMLGEQVVEGKVVVYSVAPNSPAEQAGIRAGDVILALEGQQIDNVVELVELTHAFQGREISVSVLRGDEHLLVRLTPRVRPPEGEGAMGITISMQEGYQVKTVHHPPWEAAWLGVREVWVTILLTIAGFVQMFRGAISPKELTGPVGIFQISGMVAQTGLVNLIRFTGFLSVNLCILNLLPIPGLDGGRIALILLEKIRGGKRMAPQQESLINFLGLVLIMAFMLIVSYFDILRISSGGISLP
ncbi:MAG: RIP metalloprotease RseP [Chloroflexi bacterium]|nr:RIP metalloprotease RseP [Chloroflexota bacterium]